MSVLPTSWPDVQLKDVAEDISYGYTAKASAAPVGPRMLRITDIQDGTVKWEGVPFCEIPKKRLPHFSLRDGDIVFARTGATTGKSYLIKNPPEAVFASYLIRVRPSESVVPSFLAHFFKSPNYWVQVSENISGSAQPNCNASKLADLVIPLPPIETQLTISGLLDKSLDEVGEIRKGLERIPTLLRRFRQSVLAAACSGRLTEDWRNQHGIRPIPPAPKKKRATNSKNTEIGFDPPPNWLTVELEDACENITDGDHQPPPQVSVGIPFLVIGDVASGRIDFADTRYVPQDYFDNLVEARIPRVGDVLYTVVGSYGIPVLVDTSAQFCFQRHIALLRPSIHMTSEFLRYVLESKDVYRQATEVATGSAQLTVPLGGLRQIKIALPSVEEQKQIVQYVRLLLNTCEDIEARYNRAKELVDKLPQAILAKAFRGELV